MLLRVTVLSQLGEELTAQLAAALPEVRIIEIPKEGELDAGVAGEVLVTTGAAIPNLAHVLERGVRLVHALSTGVERFPLDLLEGRTLACVRGASGPAISEWVIATMLAFEKRFPESWISEPPERWAFAGLGTLDGRTLGLVGLGGIGAALARRALPFGMRVVALRRSDSPSPVDGVEVVHDLAEVLRVADHLVLAAPATAATKHLIDAAALDQVKPGVHLVNVARGSLIDQDALHVALDDGRVAIASLDTFDPEPLPAGHWLYSHPRVHASAHVSWNNPAGLRRPIDGLAANLRRYLAGEPLEGVVDPVTGY